MASDGAYLQHRGHWDANKDGRITVQEFEADPKGIRKLLPPGFEFLLFDLNADSVYTLEEARARMKPLTDAVLADNFDGFMPWLSGAAGVQVPGTMTSWYKDHMAFPSMWDLLSKVALPVGVFQGEIDANTSAADVRALEVKAKAAGKTNLEFRYFDGLDHGLGTGVYFITGTPSTGYAAMFEFIKRIAAK